MYQLIENVSALNLASCYSDYYTPNARRRPGLSRRGLHQTVAGRASVVGDAGSVAGTVYEEMRPRLIQRTLTCEAGFFVLQRRDSNK